MRWDRLFAELEAGSEDEAVLERELLVPELADEQWAATTWVDLLDGAVALEISGGLRLEGEVRGVGERLVRLETTQHDVLVDVGHVVGVVGGRRRERRSPGIGGRLGWRQAFRSLRDDRDEVEVWRVGHEPVRGVVELAGQDFVQVRTPSGRSCCVPFRAVSAVRVPR